MGGRVQLATSMVLVALALGGCTVTGSSSTGLTYPSGPSLNQFGVRDRCADGGDCSERAMEAIQAALGRLGAEVQETPITTTAGATPPDRLYLHVTSDPPLEWRSGSGSEGTGGEIVVDLTDTNPYVVVAPGLAFELSDTDAAAIRDALFVDR